MKHVTDLLHKLKLIAVKYYDLLTKSSVEQPGGSFCKLAVSVFQISAIDTENSDCSQYFGVAHPRQWLFTALAFDGNWQRSARTRSRRCFFSSFSR